MRTPELKTRNTNFSVSLFSFCRLNWGRAAAGELPTFSGNSRVAIWNVLFETWKQNHTHARMGLKYFGKESGDDSSRLNTEIPLGSVLIQIKIAKNGNVHELRPQLLPRHAIDKYTLNVRWRLEKTLCWTATVLENFRKVNWNEWNWNSGIVILFCLHWIIPESLFECNFILKNT